MGQYKISKAGNFFGGCSGYPDAIRALAQTQARILVAGTVPIIDNSGGVADVVNRYINFPVALFDVAASGSNLATKANVDAFLVAAQNAMATLFSSALAAATRLGITKYTYNGGGTNGNGTVAAVPVTVAGASTGPSSANLNVAIAKLNLSAHALASLIKKIQVAVGANELLIGLNAGKGALTYGLGPNLLLSGGPQEVLDQPMGSNAITYGRGPNFPGPAYTEAPALNVAPLATDSGVAGAVGASAVTVQAVLAMHAANIATMAAGLASVNATMAPALLATS